MNFQGRKGARGGNFSYNFFSSSLEKILSHKEDFYFINKNVERVSSATQNSPSLVLVVSAARDLVWWLGARSAFRISTKAIIWLSPRKNPHDGGFFGCAWRDSNSRPILYKRTALPTELHAQIFNQRNYTTILFQKIHHAWHNIFYCKTFLTPIKSSPYVHSPI